MIERTILDSVACGMFTVDRDLRITAFSRSAVRITGFAEKEAIGQRGRDLFGNAHCDLDCALQRSLQTGEATPHRDIHLPDAQGEAIPICASTAPLRDQEGTLSSEG